MNRFRLPSDDLEYDILNMLWECGSATVRELHDKLAERQELAYTTTAKVVDRLREKELIERRHHGKTFIYRPCVAREAVENARARKVVSRLFGASPAPHAAVAALVDAVDAVDPKLLDELERLVKARRGPKDGT
ncbi:MAG: BlaI/MecI/CopY family transcriptional regulator [Proteobacteria bacterium]|nr:BlaI/MecI/CopY family transcriptional regulator [Pseudomonadota bacterium]